MPSYPCLVCDYDNCNCEYNCILNLVVWLVDVKSTVSRGSSSFKYKQAYDPLNETFEEFMKRRSAQGGGKNRDVSSFRKLNDSVFRFRP